MSENPKGGGGKGYRSQGNGSWWGGGQWGGKGGYRAKGRGWGNARGEENMDVEEELVPERTRNSHDYCYYFMNSLCNNGATCAHPHELLKVGTLFSDPPTSREADAPAAIVAMQFDRDNQTLYAADMNWQLRTFKLSPAGVTEAGAPKIQIVQQTAVELEDEPKSLLIVRPPVTPEETSMVVVGLENGKLQVFSSVAGTYTMETGNSAAVMCLNQQAIVLFTGDWEGNLDWWQVASDTGRLTKTHTFSGFGPMKCMFPWAEGKLIVGGLLGASVFDLAGTQILSRFDAGVIVNVSSPFEGVAMLVALDGTIYMLDSEFKCVSGARHWQMVMTALGLNCTDGSPVLVIGGQDGRGTVYSVPSYGLRGVWQIAKSVPRDTVTSLLHLEDNFFVSASDDGNICVWKFVDALPLVP